MSFLPEESKKLSPHYRNQLALVQASENNGIVNLSEMSDALVSLLETKGYLVDGKLTRDVSVSSEGCVFLKDVPGSQLEAGEQGVYPHQEESTHIIAKAADIARTEGAFDHAISCFGGAGHGEVKAFHQQVVKPDARIQSMELNPRARELAEVNTAIAGIDQVTFFAGDILQNSLPKSPEKGKTLFFGNAPFALKVQGQDLALMRDGGENGLEKTLAFAKAAFESAKQGDVIVGVAYSRLNTKTGRIELEEALSQIAGNQATVTVELMEGEKLYRNPANSKKEQDNPMPMSQLIVKATAGFEDDGTPIYDPEAKAAYQRAADMHMADDWSELGYYRYVVRVNPIGQISSPVQDAAKALTEQQ